MRPVVGLVLLLIGCRYELPENLPENLPVEPLSHATEAAAFVWGVYKEGGEAPPVIWIGGACITGDDPGWRSGCVTGTYLRVRDEAFVIPTNGSQVASTALAHELMHAHLLNQTGDVDHDHTREEWSLLPEINIQLNHLRY
jgi:hypothetical protein